MSAGRDVATIRGGGSGSNTLTINKNALDFTLKDYQGHVWFQTGSGGTTITVANMNRITVIGMNGETIWQYSSGSGTVPPAIAQPLLLGN